MNSGCCFCLCFCFLSLFLHEREQAQVVASHLQTRPTSLHHPTPNTHAQLKYSDRYGLVSRVVPADELVPTAIEMGEKIASFSKPTTAICKEAVNAAYEMTLAEGVRFERRMFHATFGTEDQKEGMAAFVEKRAAEFKDN